jgi:GSCFA family
VVTERNFRGFLTNDVSLFSDASAAWGIIFNTPSFRQLVERSFGLRRLPRILWSNGEYYMDPFREEIRFASVEEYLTNYEPHLAAARAAFAQAKVLIITLGLNEIWSFKMDGSIFSRSPWRIAPSFVEHRILSPEENVRDLELMLKILRQQNPNLQLIVTLSPIPLHATFLHDRCHVVEANMHSKAVLRIAAQEFVEKNEGVYYFPSFELATYGFQNPWTEDHRHTNRSVVGRVMEMFREMFVI